MSYHLNEFQKELIRRIYSGSIKIRELARQFGVPYENLKEEIDELVRKGLVRTEIRRQGLFEQYTIVLLTPSGLTFVNDLEKKRVRRATAEPEGPVEVSSTTKQPSIKLEQKQSTGLETCGLACLLIVIFGIIVMVILGIRIDEFIKSFFG